MSIFKNLKSSDVVITPYKAYKSWSTWNSPDLVTNDSVSFTTYNNSLYLYETWKIEYNDMFAGDLPALTKGNLITHLYYDGNFSENYRGHNNNFSGSLLVISPTGLMINIRRSLYGEEIKRHSLIVGIGGPFNYTLYDDGNNNVVSGNGDFWGNVFYEHGLVSMIDPGIPIIPISVSFQGTVTRYEYEVKCTVGANELNHTLNKTAYSGSYTSSVSGNLLVDNAYYKPYTTHSEWSPYITSIGLYDDGGNLLAIGKTSQPVKKNQHVDTTFVVRFDK